MASEAYHPQATRRDFLGRASLAGIVLGETCLAGSRAESRELSPQSAAAKPQICAFVKFVQSLSYEQLAEEIAAMGFAGIEATVRKGGHVDPNKVEEQLPALVEALAKCGLKVLVMASDINRADDPLARRVLKTASQLEISTYRMKYYKYDLRQPLLPQLKAYRETLDGLVALNRELGLQAVYQNHSGGNRVGAPVWDLADLLTGVSPQHVGVAFDIRHATVEGGLAWPLHFKRIRPHLGAVYVKDFVWDRSPRRPRNVPLGEGLVDRAFFRQLVEIGYEGVVSLHVEYLPKAGIEKNLQALRDDLATLRELLASES